MHDIPVVSYNKHFSKANNSVSFTSSLYFMLNKKHKSTFVHSWISLFVRYYSISLSFTSTNLRGLLVQKVTADISLIGVGVLTIWQMRPTVTTFFVMHIILATFKWTTAIVCTFLTHNTVQIYRLIMLPPNSAYPLKTVKQFTIGGFCFCTCHSSKTQIINNIEICDTLPRLDADWSSAFDSTRHKTTA